VLVGGRKERVNILQDTFSDNQNHDLERQTFLSVATHPASPPATNHPHLSTP